MIRELLANYTKVTRKDIAYEKIYECLRLRNRERY